MKADLGKEAANAIMKKVEDVYTKELYIHLCNKVVPLIFDKVIEHRQYRNFTGNTLTSFSIGIWQFGTLTDIFNIVKVENIDRPVWHKLTRGQHYYFDGNEYPRTYDGGVGWITPKKQTDEGWGLVTARNILMEYMMPNSIPIGLVVTTGTEYSAYLENIRGLDVITDTYQDMRSGALIATFKHPLIK